MEPDKQLLEAWENGVALGDAWLALADAENRKRYFKARREGSPSSIRISLEIDLVARLSDGELQAIGIEGESDPRPALIPRYFFSKSAEVNLDRDTVAAFGKKFHEVRVQGERARERPDETRPTGPPPVIDPREITAQRERERSQETPPSAPKTSREPHEITDQGEREPPQETLPSEPAPTAKPRMGRPPVLSKVREVVRELIDGNEFDNLSKKEIVTSIRSRAKQRFQALFPKPTQPSINKIIEALKPGFRSQVQRG
jgi:hypothetical protein